MENETFFNEYGYAYLENILTEEQCLNFASIMILMKEKNRLSYEGITSTGEPSTYYKNSFGGNSDEFEVTLREIQPRIEATVGTKLVPCNSFARIYYNGGILTKHIDRSGLDYTLSVTLLHNLDSDWPLWCTDLKGNNVPLVIKQGDGGLMLGTTLTHWREPLICNDDQFAIQLFMHWTKA